MKARTRLARIPRSSPAAEPQASNLNARPSAACNTSFGRAPSAMRIPSSRRRLPTEYAAMPKLPTIERARKYSRDKNCLADLRKVAFVQLLNRHGGAPDADGNGRTFARRGVGHVNRIAGAQVFEPEAMPLVVDENGGVIYRHKLGDLGGMFEEELMLAQVHGRDDKELVRACRLGWVGSAGHGRQGERQRERSGR